ncbi:MAG: hypothetical protein V1927_01130 [Candidatus Omnitrophota bacterium]
MKNKHLILILLFFVVLSTTFGSSAQNVSIEGLKKQGYAEDAITENHWKIDYPAINNPEVAQKKSVNPGVRNASSETYIVHSDYLDKKGYGGALNIRYFSGLSYDYLQKNLPGRTISLSIYVPKESVSPNKDVPNRLRVTIKSEKNGIWADYYDGSEWKGVESEGVYTFKIKIPEKPVKMNTGKIFYPDYTTLICVEYFMLEGEEYHSHITFYFYDFRIDGIDLNPKNLKWQFMKNGYVVKDAFLPNIPDSSAIIDNAGNSIELEHAGMDTSNTNDAAESVITDNSYLVSPVSIPRKLLGKNGIVALTVKDGQKTDTAVRKFNTANAEGKIFIAMPLKGFAPEKNIKGFTKNKKISFLMKSVNAHGADMEPIVIEPIKIRTGRLIPFDMKWSARDVQGLGGYEYIEIRSDGLINKEGITVKELGDNLYQANITVRLKGGIDWNSPYYRVELMRKFDNGPVDLDNMRLELEISPLTDTTNMWQKPYRIRLGVLDINDKVMFGPNFSLSDGLSKTLYLDVSSTNPQPRGLVMPGFNLKKIKAIIINMEATHARLESKDLRILLANLSISPKKNVPAKEAKSIDFSRLKRNIDRWQMMKIIKNNGGYVAALNYPFPVVDVSQDIMEVPQVYPTVGRKPNDKMHFGFSGVITRKKVLEDFKKFVSEEVGVVRLFTLGHLEGVFKWDEKGEDIAAFEGNYEPIIRDAGKLSVEKFAEFLSSNEEGFFQKNEAGRLVGFEEHVIKDFEALLDILEEVEKETGKKLFVIISMFDFMFADDITKEGPFGKYVVGEHQRIVTDPTTRAKCEALIWKLLRTLAKDRRFYDYVACVEVMNEPANAAALVTKENFTNLVDFVMENLYLFKDALGPDIPVTIGFESWPDNLAYWKGASEGIDILMPHYWESLESYNINQEGLWPLDMNAGELWKKLGTEPKGRPTGIGEIGPGGNLKKNLFVLEKAGYDFALAWSYSGHDGHDVKPVMDSVSQYQIGSREFLKIMNRPSDELKKAFDFLLQARASFEAAGGNDNESMFITRASEDIKNMGDESLKKTLKTLLEISVLKNIQLTRQNILYIWSKASSNTVDLPKKDVQPEKKAMEKTLAIKAPDISRASVEMPERAIEHITLVKPADLKPTFDLIAEPYSAPKRPMPKWTWPIIITLVGGIGIGLLSYLIWLCALSFVRDHR